jgi:NAD(P)-dependent dehydrogenase (short-subunit alcohol dehydrogenase family)
MTTYLITGASRGIGREFVNQLAARGDAVLATARDPGTLPKGVESFALDVSSEGSIRALAAALGDRPIDVLINNAGVTSPVKSVAELSFSELGRVYATNVFAPMVLAGVLLPNLRAGQRKIVVNISSTMGSMASAAANKDAKSYAYRSSKSALNMLNVCQANELRGEGFTCVAVHPGWVKTDMGGGEAPLSAKESVAAMLRTIDGLTPERTGAFIERDGRPIDW